MYGLLTWGFKGWEQTGRIHWRDELPSFKMRYLLVVLAPLALAGCVTDEDQRAMDQD
nr:hypothetical protein [Nitrosomonas nitrosa]